MKKILICDDHSAIRSGLKLILGQEYPGTEFGEASSATEVTKKIAEKNWDLLILDLDMPGRNGLEVLQQIKTEKTNIRVLIFSMHPEEQIAIRAMKLGAYGYLSKDTADTELLKAVDQVLNGKKYISASLGQAMVSQLENPEQKALHESLSDREYQTLILIAKGKTISEIANELSLSIPTISTYRSRILEKTGMKTSAELTSYAVRNKLV